MVIAPFYRLMCRGFYPQWILSPLSCDDEKIWRWLLANVYCWGEDSKKDLRQAFAFYSVRECFNLLSAQELSLVSLALGLV